MFNPFIRENLPDDTFGAVGVDMFINNINACGMVLLVVLFIASITEKRDPLFYIAVSAFVGLVAGFFNLTGN